MKEHIDDESVQDSYNNLYKKVIEHIEQTKNDINVIKEKAILEIYWKLGEILIEKGDISKTDLKRFKDEVNKEIKHDPLLRWETINTHWLKLAKLWVSEHYHHAKQRVLSGYVSWVHWALLLDIVNSAPQRYWLACQTIKRKWDTIGLLKAAQSLPHQYLNLGSTNIV